MELQHKDITDKIIKAFYKVYNELGFGFLEKVYENALFKENQIRLNPSNPCHPCSIIVNIC